MSKGTLMLNGVDYSNAGGGDTPIATTDTLGVIKVGDGLSVTEDGTLSASGGNIDYSTTEQLTGEKWIDGRPIYIKTIYNQTTLYAPASNYGLYVDNFDMLIDCKFIIMDKNKYTAYTLPYTGLIDNYTCKLDYLFIPSQSIIKIYTDTTFNNAITIITFKYVKRNTTTN